MKKNKILITINELNDIAKLKELGINHYVFPLKDFCVGIPNTFLVSEIPKDVYENSYLFLNRVLDNKGIDELKKIIDSLPNIKGLIFDDVGVIPLIKDKNFESILFLNHFNTNKESVKIYLQYVDSVIVSTDITQDEIEGIVKSNPEVTLFVLGYVNAMYSRRLLIDNYVKYHHLKRTNPLKIKNGNQEFLVYENAYGTVFLASPLFNGLSLTSLKAKYYFINSAFLTFEDIKDLLEGKSSLDFNDGFLNRETIYKLKGE